jgi:hypothetical protein
VKETDARILSEKLDAKDKALQSSQTVIDALQEEILAIKAENEANTAALRKREEEFRVLEMGFSSSLGSEKAAREHAIAIEAQAKEHAIAMEAQADALEDEFRSRMCLKMDEFRLLDEENKTNLAVRADALATLERRIEELTAASDTQANELRRTSLELGFRNTQVENLLSNSDSKHRTFMFAFSGRGVNFDVFNNENRSRTNKIEVGHLYNGNSGEDDVIKYCVMHLTRNYGRRLVNLINVVQEYNRSVEDGWKITLRQLQPVMGVEQPLIFVLPMHPDNEIQRKVVRDRAGLQVYCRWIAGMGMSMVQPTVQPAVLSTDEDSGAEV